MKTKILYAVLFMLLSIFGRVYKTEAAALGSYFEEDLHLTKEGSPYEVADNGVYVSPGHEVVIDPGVEVRFSSGSLYLDHSNIRIGSPTSSERVILNSMPGGNKWMGIYVDEGEAIVNSTEVRGANRAVNMMGGSLRMSSSTVEGFSNIGIYMQDTEGFINNSIIWGNNRAIFYGGDTSKSFSGSGNRFSSNSINIFNDSKASTLDFRGNDWGTGGTPAQGTVIGKVITGFEGATCCSSIVFLPGLEASRLYIGDNKVWEPNSPLDIEKLYLDENGDSILEGVHVKEGGKDRGVIDEAFGLNVYKNFLKSMDDLVASSGNKVKEFKVFPYDWRKDIYDAASDEMVDQIIDVASRSNNGKVSLVAHSNGGLIGKILIDKLRSRGKSDIVERFIMVAVPQLGTPVAAAALLHGDGQDIPRNMGFLINKSIMRKLGEHMQSAYTLVPSQGYFDKIDEPVITFDSSVNQIFNHQEYGDTIDSASELQEFMISDDRDKPSFSDEKTPNVLPSHFAAQADSQHNYLDSWAAPSNIKVIQVAGWGVDTVGGIQYSAKRKSKCEAMDPHCFEWEHNPLLVLDGDNTVVVPSAVAQDEEKYYVNLRDHNDDLLFGLRRNRSHADILEVESLQNLIKNIVASSSAALPLHVSRIKPETTESTRRLRFGLHSPVSIAITDSSGNYTGVSGVSSSGFVQIKQQVPNSYYMEFGEGKYVGVSGEGNYQVKLKGTGSGTFTFDVEEYKGRARTVRSFIDIPVATSTVALLSNTSNIEKISLKIDMTGDGVYEKEVTPQKVFDPIQFLKELKQRVAGLKLAPKWEKEILSKIDKLIAVIEKNKRPKLITLFSKYLERLEQEIKKKDAQGIKNQLTLLELL